MPDVLMQPDATQKRTKLVPGASDGKHLVMYYSAYQPLAA